MRGFTESGRIQPAAARAPNTFRSPSVHLPSALETTPTGGRWSSGDEKVVQVGDRLRQDRALLPSPGSEGLRQVGEGGWKVDGSDSRTHPNRERSEMMRFVD